MSKWAVNRNCPITLLEFCGWEFEKMKYILLLVLLLDHRQTGRWKDGRRNGETDRERDGRRDEMTGI
jgi:hypothetical protein